MIRNRFHWLTVVLAGVSVVVSVSETTHAQSRPGTLRLVVRDATDLAIPGATVTLTSSNGVTRNAAANERGEAHFDGLTPGDYAARIESPGFTPVDLKELRVRAGA